MNLFTDRSCDYCGGGMPSTRNPFLWAGFLDMDTNQLVCHSCKGNHYWAKAQAMGTALPDGDISGMTYSEYPVENRVSERG